MFPGWFRYPYLGRYLLTFCIEDLNVICSLKFILVSEWTHLICRLGWFGAAAAAAASAECSSQGTTHNMPNSRAHCHPSRRGCHLGH